MGGRLLILVLLGFGVLAGPAPPAHASLEETEFLAMVNAERVSRGIPLLTDRPVISDNLSRPWSQQMAMTGQLVSRVLSSFTS